MPSLKNFTMMQSLKIDEIAERILTPGHTPYYSFTDYPLQFSIKEASNVSDGKKAIFSTS
jgi:starvation-inducible DNA-binding protein